MLPGEFYEYDVEAYEAIEEYAGPFESIYYMGSGIDRTPSESFQTDDILHADHDPGATEFLSSKGLETATVDVTQYAPRREFDLVLLAHLTDIKTTGSPLVEDVLKKDGSVICSTEPRAKKLSERTDLGLEAVYIDEEVVQDTGIVSDADKYFFR